MGCTIEKWAGEVVILRIRYLYTMKNEFILNVRRAHMKILALLIVLLVSPVVVSYAEEVTEISGSLRSGFRILEVRPEQTDNSFTVYRGDYIKFSYPEKYTSLAFSMLDLKYTGILLPDPDQAPFFKMKQAGDYPFQMGEGGGVISVIELVRPNYIEVTASEAAELIKNVDPFILDVRTKGEYQQVHIEGSHLIPIQEMQKRIGELESQKHQDVFVYCATGNRSTVASKILADAGFKRIYNLRYGVYDWARKGYPYATGK
ncbi:MAG: rhodanese-related sulfurtransferase [Desulforhopalus sp.]